MRRVLYEVARDLGMAALLVVIVLVVGAAWLLLEWVKEA